MKREVLLAARILSAYFIALPILIGYHTILHGHDCIEVHSDGLAYDHASPDCELCDIYYDQTATLEPCYSNENGHHWLSFQLPLTSNFDKVSLDLIFPRGPPVV